MSEVNQQLALFDNGHRYDGFWNADQHPTQQWLFRELNGDGTIIDWQTAAWLAPEVATVKGWVEAEQAAVSGIKRILDESSIPPEPAFEEPATYL